MATEGYPEVSCGDLLRCLSQLDDVTIARIDWREFESHCTQVLEENGYRVLGSVWFSDQERRYQIDVVGVRMKRVVCIDCKAWTTGGGTHRSRKAAEAQKVRTVKLKASLSSKGSSGTEEMAFFPLIVTLKAEGVFAHDGVAIVPFEMLNAFLVDFDSYRAELFRA